MFIMVVKEVREIHIFMQEDLKTGMKTAHSLRSYYQP